MVFVEQRFSKVADLYDRHRPGYPEAIVDWLLTLSPARRVLDIGCGTGISARLFASRGLDVTGVDPNEEMLAKARAHGGGPIYEHAAAEALPFDDATFDLAYAAQAFHWFDLERVMPELRRVLRPNAWAAAFWNVRRSTAAMDAYEALLLRASSEYGTLARPADTIAAIRSYAAKHRLETRETALDNAQHFDWPAFHGRVHSSSYVAHGVADVAAFDRELRAIFDAHAVDDCIVFAYRVDAVAWR